MRAALALVAWCAEQVAPRYILEVGWEQAISCAAVGRPRQAAQVKGGDPPNGHAPPCFLHQLMCEFDLGSEQGPRWVLQFV